MCTEAGNPGIPRPSAARSSSGRTSPLSLAVPSLPGVDTRKGQFYALRPLLLRALAVMVVEQPPEPLP